MTVYITRWIFEFTAAAGRVKYLARASHECNVYTTNLRTEIQDKIIEYSGQNQLMEEGALNTKLHNNKMLLKCVREYVYVWKM